MKRRTTIYEIANRLGVSPSTVNRALNGSIQVRPELKELIRKTADEMGYRYNKVAGSLSREAVRITAVLYNAVDEYSAQIRSGILSAFEKLTDNNLKGQIVSLPRESSAEDYYAAVKEAAAQGADGLVLLPHTFSQEMKDLIDELAAQEIKTGIVVSDVPDSRRVISVRRNGELCGGISAELLARFTGPGKKVAVLTPSRMGVVHNESVQSFLRTAKANQLDVVGVYEHFDDPEKAGLFAESLFSEHPDLNGIYFNSASAYQFCRKLTQLGYNGKIRLAVMELMPEIREYVLNGTVDFAVFCNPYLQGKKVVECLYKSIAEHKEYKSGNILIEPHVVMKSNIDYYMNR